MTKQTLRLAFGLMVLAAPLALIGCDEPKPTTPATPAGAPVVAPGGPGAPIATPSK